MKTILFILSLCLLLFRANAQSYNKGEQTLVAASQLIIENYSTIQLGSPVMQDEKANRFDANNVATYLQILTDNNGRKYHILLQLNVMGKLSFLSISNNLAMLFNKREKPMFGFNHCANELNSFMSARQNIEAAVNCVVARLEYCAN